MKSLSLRFKYKVPSQRLSANLRKNNTKIVTSRKTLNGPYDKMESNREFYFLTREISSQRVSRSVVVMFLVVIKIVLAQ